MKPLQLLPVGNVADELLGYLETAIPRTLLVPCQILTSVLDPTPTFHVERRQYHSSELLARMQAVAGSQCWRLLGIADLDLYIPILTFVFGEAQIGGPCALVSAQRLRQEFYSLPPDKALLEQRLLKEVIHEIGHTCDLTHCDNYACAMAPSHAVEWIDLKEPRLCSACNRKLLGYLQCVQ
jgi:archaemetzincin